MNYSCDPYPFNLGDKRLGRRAGRIVQAALEHAGDGIPTAAGSLAACDATYRFFDNPNVLPSDLDDAHTRWTVDLAAHYPGVLPIAQDTTDADFTSPVRNGRLGQLAHAKHFGFYVHSALALTANGLPPGLLHRHVWMRPRRNAANATIADRECDFYDHFAAERRPGRHVSIRAKLRRRIAGPKELLGAATCDPAVSAEEWEVLWRHFRPEEAPPPQPPTLRQAMRRIGRLGGFPARQGDGEPGVKVLWRGLRQLQAMLIGFRLANAAAHGVQSSDES